MTEFTERYKKLSNFELLEIVSNSSKYQSIAVETAKQEIANRNLSEEDLAKVKLEIKSNQLEKRKQIEKRNQKEDKIKQNIYSFFDLINPIQNGIQTPEKVIRLIILIFAGISIYKIFTEFGMIYFILTNGETKWDLSIIEYFLPLIILPLAVILFWKRKKIGWILLSLFLTYSSVISVRLFFLTIGHQPIGLPAMDSLFPLVSPIDYLFSLLFYGGTLWLICKENSREIFRIKKKEMNQTIGITTFLTVIHIIVTHV